MSFFTSEEQKTLDTAAQILERHAFLRQQAEVADSTDSARKLVQYKLLPYEHEVFACLFLDNQHRLIQFAEMFRGTIDGASVYPREVVKKALALNAAAVIFAHNHPSGVAEPSAQDIAITHRLKNALAMVDIRVLDHIIVGCSTTSLAERCLI